MDRFTLDRLDDDYCSRCREFVIPGEDDECPFCSSQVSDYGSLIDAVCNEDLHGSLR